MDFVEEFYQVTIVSGARDDNARLNPPLEGSFLVNVDAAIDKTMGDVVLDM